MLGFRKEKRIQKKTTSQALSRAENFVQQKSDAYTPDNFVWQKSQLLCI